MNSAARAVASAGILGFWLITAVYGVVCFSPLAFEQFVRPQLLPGLNTFVAWHHLLHLPVYAASLVLLWPLIERRPGGASGASWLARGYAVAFGVVALALLFKPQLPLLWNDNRSLIASLLALIAPLWLALATCAAFARPWHKRRSDGKIGDVVSALTLTAVLLWCAHGVHLLLQTRDNLGATTAQLSMALFWVIALSVAIAIVELLGLVVRMLRLSVLVEAGIASVAAGGWLCFFLVRYILPTVQIEGIPAVAFGVGTSITLALSWMAAALRRSVTRDPDSVGSGYDLVCGFSASPVWLAVILLLSPVASLAIVGQLGKVDWMSSFERVTINLEWLVAFIAAYGMVRRRGTEDSARRPALAAMAAGLTAMIMVSTGVVTMSGQRDRALEQHIAREPAYRFARSLVAGGGAQDASFYRFIQQLGSAEARATTPSIPTPTRPAGNVGPRPDVYLFVIDSLRRDYLSPYNPAVSFTPNIDAFAADNFVFKNTFTRHGGTALAMSSIWAGRFVVRGVRAPGFERMNLLEQILHASEYRIAINDFTVAGLLKEPVHVVDPEAHSVETDLCSNIKGLEAYLDEVGSDRPAFGFFAPMNVHILNTRTDAGGADLGAYPGFYAPYAQRLSRIDGCFGAFIAYLKQRGTYDNSIIVLTSDHGDSLGERNHWGHQYWLFPEDIRVPLIMRIPPSLKAATTTDLARVTFTSDLAPTLLTLLGYDGSDLGPLAGEPLFVKNPQELSPRRLDRFLISSSYGSSLAMLTRNGTELYISDLFERKDFAFDLHRTVVGSDRTLDSDTQARNQQWIRDAMVDVAAFYNIAIP